MKLFSKIIGFFTKSSSSDLNNVLSIIAKAKKRINKKIEPQKAGYLNRSHEAHYTVNDVGGVKLSNLNAIHVIHPYKKDGIWMFDDEKMKILQEPFVSGADEILDFVSGYRAGCTLTFSDSSFPDSTHYLKKTYEISSDMLSADKSASQLDRISRMEYTDFEEFKIDPKTG